MRKGVLPPESVHGPRNQSYQLWGCTYRARCDIVKRETGTLLQKIHREQRPPARRHTGMGIRHQGREGG